MVRRSLLCAAVLLAAWPDSAHAANGLRPRTPAEFSDVPCVQTVTRGEILHIDYAVAFDDTELTPDELLDSRKHQFFAFSRVFFDFSFPRFINESDFSRAEANGDITGVVPFGPDDILDTSSLWPAGTYLRVTPDDPRLPITMEQAAMGVDWDTTDVAPGTWVVAAYTWEPENNIWSTRFGAVRVVDPANPDSAGPSVFIPPETRLAIRGEPLDIRGCVDAPEGSTITASWGNVTGGAEPQWVPFLEDEPVDNGELLFEFVAPAETGANVKLRVEITDPQGRSYVAFTPEVIGVSGEFVEPPADGGEGCCSIDRPPSVWSWLGLLLLLGLRPRRRAA